MTVSEMKNSDRSLLVALETERLKDLNTDHQNIQICQRFGMLSIKLKVEIFLNFSEIRFVLSVRTSLGVLLSAYFSV